MARIDLRPMLVFAIAGLLLIAGGTASVAAHTTAGDQATSADRLDTGDHRIAIQDVTVHIADTHVTGPGLPEKSVDEAAFTVDDATVSTDGFVVTITGHDLRVGHITVTFDNVGLTLENVSIGGSDTR